jgi:hypothetical protein
MKRYYLAVENGEKQHKMVTFLFSLYKFIHRAPYLELLSSIPKVSLSYSSGVARRT